MRRLNPKTGKLFKFGDIREDGYFFWGYTNRVGGSEYFHENWCSPATFYKNNEKAAKYTSENRHKRREYNAFRYLKFTEQIKTRNKHYDTENKVGRSARNAKRRAAKLQRTPSWLTKDQLRDIQDFYTIAKMFTMYSGIPHVVDHIVALQGKTASGLHVPWNLQVLTAKDNLEKGNKSA